MTSSIKTVLLSASISCSVVGFVAWRVHATRTEAVPQYEIVEDSSRSHLSGCESLLGLAEQVLQHESSSPTSQLTILVTGDHATASEPRRVAKYTIPRTRKAIEGRGAGLRREQEVLADLHKKCQSLRSTDISPIFLAIKEALADLRAQGCNRSSGCKLYVDSDGEENVDKDIKQALNDGARARHSLPARADNTGIQVIFCGLAATSGGPDSALPRTAARDSRRDDRLKLTWQSVFVMPDVVNLEPYCPTSSMSDTHSKVRTW